MSYRDRVTEFRRVHSTELLDNEGNFRQHPSIQKNAFQAVIDEIGIAGALVVYYSERNGGKLTAIDGHMRKNDFPADWPCLVTDLNDEEADKLLLTHDPVAMLAVHDAERLRVLRENSQFLNRSVDVMLDSLPKSIADKSTSEMGGKDPPPSNEHDVPGMELLPYEHYDYLLVVARTTMDWYWLCDRLGISQVEGGNDPRYKKLGLGRALPADRLIQALRAGEDAQLELDQLKKKKRKPESVEA